MFPTEEAYLAEAEVISRAQRVADEIHDLGIPVKSYPADEYFLTNILVDKPELVFNLVDTLHGKDNLQISIPASLEMIDIPYTGTDVQGLVISNSRYLTKQMLNSQKIPTPAFQYINGPNFKIHDSLGYPLIAKLNSSGGSVGIDNRAVLENHDTAVNRVKEMQEVYKMPIILEKFIDGQEVTAVVFDDGIKKHILLALKDISYLPDDKHAYTSFESYSVPNSYVHKRVKLEFASDLQSDVLKAFKALHFRDYGKFDVRVDRSQKYYITDSNPNTAFGPSLGLPFTEIADLYGITFIEILKSLLTKYALKLQTRTPSISSSPI